MSVFRDLDDERTLGAGHAPLDAARVSGREFKVRPSDRWNVAAPRSKCEPPLGDVRLRTSPFDPRAGAPRPGKVER